MTRIFNYYNYTNIILIFQTFSKKTWLAVVTPLTKKNSKINKFIPEIFYLYNSLLFINLFEIFYLYDTKGIVIIQI